MRLYKSKHASEIWRTVTHVAGSGGRRMCGRERGCSALDREEMLVAVHGLGRGASRWAQHVERRVWRLPQLALQARTLRTHRPARSAQVLSTSRTRYFHAMTFFPAVHHPPSIHCLLKTTNTNTFSAIYYCHFDSRKASLSIFEKTKLLKILINATINAEHSKVIKTLKKLNIF